MLILTRRITEKIVINNNIKIEILGIKGSQVRLGLDAPPSVSIHREEVFNRIQAERGNEITQTEIMPGLIN